jgi:hypothetical protein
VVLHQGAAITEGKRTFGTHRHRLEVNNEIQSAGNIKRLCGFGWLLSARRPITCCNSEDNRHSGPTNC